MVGGKSTYTYVLTASNGDSIPAGQANNQYLTGLRSGKYKVVVNTLNGCTSTKTFQLNCPHPIAGCNNKHGDDSNDKARINETDTNVITLSAYLNPFNSYTDKISTNIQVQDRR